MNNYFPISNSNYLDYQNTPEPLGQRQGGSAEISYALTDERINGLGSRAGFSLGKPAALSGYGERSFDALETAKTVGAYGITTVASAALGGLSGVSTGVVVGFQLGEGLVQRIFRMHGSSEGDPKLRTAYQILSLAAGLVAGAGGAIIGFGIGAIKGAVEGFKNYQSHQAVEPAIANVASSAYQTRLLAEPLA